MGNCLFIPSEEKIEYRSPGLLSGGSGPGSLIQSPWPFRPGIKDEIKSATAGTPAVSCLVKHNCWESAGERHTRTLPTRRALGWQEFVNKWWRQRVKFCRLLHSKPKEKWELRRKKTCPSAPPNSADFSHLKIMQCLCVSQAASAGHDLYAGALNIKHFFSFLSLPPTGFSAQCAP